MSTNDKQKQDNKVQPTQDEKGHEQNEREQELQIETLEERVAPAQLI